MKIKKLLSKIIDNRGKTPPTTEEGYDLIEINSIAGVSKYPDYSLIKKHVSKETYLNWFRAGHPQIGDILIPTVGTLNAIGYMDRNDCCIAQNLIALRVDPEICDSQYLYYLLCWNNVRQRLLNLDIGAVQPSIKVPHLKNLEVKVPDLRTQKKIGTLLNEFDEKIKKNDEINKNLSDQLQALYSSEFDPMMYPVTGTLSDICHYSSERVNVDQLTTKTYYSTENMQPNKASAVEATNFPNIKQATKCHAGDVLVSNIRPYFKKIEYVTTACGCSADVLCFVPESKELSAFLYETVYADRFFDYMVAGSKGTKMPRGDKQQIMQYEIVMPSPEQLSAFNAIATPMLALIGNQVLENERLSTLRDSLLPKLVSGEIDVSDIDL